MRLGLPEHTISFIVDVLTLYPAVERAVVYGSRAKGCHTPGSDIDLCLFWSTITAAVRNAIV